MNLPFPDCAARPSECDDLNVINTLDGFNVQPRLSVPFSGPIDVSTATSDTIFLIHLGSTLPDETFGGKVIGINQIVWGIPRLIPYMSNPTNCSINTAAMR